MFIKKIGLFTLLLIFFHTSYAAVPADELAALLSRIQTLQASFTQIIYDNNGVAVQHSQGKMALWRPGRFRWEVKKPIPQLIIANHNRLWIYDRDLEQVTIRALDQSRGESPALLLSHVNSVLEKDFTIHRIPNKNPPLNWFELLPKQKDSMFASIKLGFLGDQIKEMDLEDHLGHTTYIKFSNIQLNKSLPDTLFVFKNPTNVDVVDETKR